MYVGELGQYIQVMVFTAYTLSVVTHWLHLSKFPCKAIWLSYSDIPRRKIAVSAFSKTQSCELEK